MVNLTEVPLQAHRAHEKNFKETGAILKTKSYAASLPIRHTLAKFGILALLIAASPLAHAQSSVTLYGLISVGLSYSSNAGGKPLYQMMSGPQQPSRWGLKGKEDLGGGRSAIFDVENGFSITNGSTAQGGRLFGRQAWVGIADEHLGTITMGRQYDEMTQELNWTESAAQFATYGAHIGDNDNVFDAVRLQNSVRYQSPVIAGLSFAGQYAFSNQAGAFSNNSAFSAGGTYMRGPLKVTVAMSQYNHPAAANNTSGAIGDSYGFTSPFTTSLGGSGVEKQRMFGAGAGYDFGIVRATVSYTNVLFDYLDTSGLRLQNVELSLTHHITPALLIGAAYIYTTGEYSNSEEPHYNEVNLGIDYSLSARTDVYVVGLYQRAGGAAQYAQIFSTAASTSNSETQVITGIRTRF